MKFFRLDLLTLLISLFILNSCKHQEAIGIDSTSQLNGSLIDTATVVVNTLNEDSVITSGLAKTPLAYFTDPVMGTTEANIAALLNLPDETAYTLPTGTISIDSAVLVLRYADGFYGDSLNSKYQVNVFQLTERPTNKSYYNTKQWDKVYDQANMVGTKSFFAHTHDSISVTNIRKGQQDTLMKVAPQLRVPISKAFINNILFNAGSVQLSSNTVFQNTVKGLYITLDKAQTTGPGGTIMLDMTDSINVYYKTVSGTTIDTAMTSLPLTTHAAQIKHTHSATVQTAINNGTAAGGTIYFEGLAGTRVKINFPYLTKLRSQFMAKDSDIVINRAELVVTPSPGSNIPYTALPKITMYRYDIAHTPITLQDASTTSPRSGGILTFGGYYSKTLKNYHFIVTAYIQDLMNGYAADYGTYMAPVDTTNKLTVDIKPTPQAAARTIAVGNDKTSPNRIKLNIIYTKIKKAP